MVHLLTVSFCRSCGWNETDKIDPDMAGNPCPECKSGLSAMHYDADYVDNATGYNEAEEARKILESQGVKFT